MQKLNWLSSKENSEVRDITSRFWKTLSPKAYPITKGSMRVPISLEPFILSKNEYADLQKGILLVISAARKLAEHYFDDVELRAVFSLHPTETDLIDASKDESFVGPIRADLFYAKKPKIVELNTDFPDGLFLHDITAKCILDILPSTYHSPSNATLFQELLETEGVSKDEHIFVGYDAGRKFIDEFALTQTQLKQAGWKNVSYGPLEELAYRDGALYFNTERIEVIRRGVETAKLRSNTELLSQLITAQSDSGLKIINNFKMRLLGHKALLAALWDRRFERYLTTEEVEAVRNIIPETLKLETTSIETVRAHKDDWVLKPSDLAEGKGVVIGSASTEEEWSAHLTDALRNPQGWLVQRKVVIPKETFSIFDTDTDKIHVAEMSYDLDPHIVLFRDHAEMGNMLVRFSPSEILNVMRGGGLTYAFVEN
ncbi:hypothetical protein EXS57_00360 [Candidatus Kaiserbacteria bacterium]|nr:hypothetical protein [Candidatus Kaiserbacteria bacterium]